jgi:hypothetical protein
MRKDLDLYCLLACSYLAKNAFSLFPCLLVDLPTPNVGIQEEASLLPYGYGFFVFSQAVPSLSIMQLRYSIGAPAP